MFTSILCSPRSIQWASFLDIPKSRKQNGRVTYHTPLYTVIYSMSSWEIKEDLWFKKSSLCVRVCMCILYEYVIDIYISLIMQILSLSTNHNLIKNIVITCLKKRWKKLFLKMLHIKWLNFERFLSTKKKIKCRLLWDRIFLKNIYRLYFNSNIFIQ